MRFRLRSKVGQHPALYYASYGLRPRNRPATVKRDTEIVIEGFPRSGNTFAVFAFQAAQPRPIRIAHHLHSQSQIIRGAKLGIPVCVLVRNPLDAAKSFAVMYAGVTFKEALRLYRDFYEGIYAFRESFVVATFEEVTTNFAEPIRRINNRFGSHFIPFSTSPESVAQVETLIDRSASWLPTKMESAGLSRPTGLKQEMKATLNSAAPKALLDEVGNLYRRYLALADRGTTSTNSDDPG
jgi:hypothetical protein